MRRHPFLLGAALALALAGCSSEGTGRGSAAPAPAPVSSALPTAPSGSAARSGPVTPSRPASASAPSPGRSPSLAPGASVEPAPPSSLASGPPGSRQVAAAVKNFYDRYATDPASPDTRGYLTPTAAAQVFAAGGNVDRVYCAQNAPTSVSISAPAVSGSDATVTVITHWTRSADQKVLVTVALPDMLISRITCPNP